MDNYQQGGQRGALQGLKVEQTLAQRLAATVVGGQGGKADIQEPSGQRHSVKSHLRSKYSRLEAKSYSTCSEKYPELVPYHEARVNGDSEGEQVAAERIAELYTNNTDRAEEVFRQILTLN